MREITIKVPSDLEERILSKNPVIEKIMLKSYKGKINEGDILKFTSETGKFLARGYYGVQNKSFGWMLSYNYKQKINEKFFKQIINRAISKRNELHSCSHTDAYRIFNAEGDGIGGLSIDIYGAYVLIQWYSKGIYQYKDIIVRILRKRMPDVGLFEKRRFGVGGEYVAGQDFIYGSYPNGSINVSQHNIQYMVDLDDGAMTGLFLDQRHVRNYIKYNYAKDKTVLNLFSYTGAFGVAAKLGGASSVTNVDMANRSIELTKRNYEINGLEYTNRDTVIMDVFKFISWANKNNKKWDVIVLDPPSFSRSKKKTFKVETDYMNLVKEVSKLINDGGVLVASTNYSKWSKEEFLTELLTSIRVVRGLADVKKVFSLPEDFCVNYNYPESDYLKVAVVEISI